MDPAMISTTVVESEPPIPQAGRSLPVNTSGDKQARGLPAFRPLPILRGGHAQTVAAMFWPSRSGSYASEHRLIDLPDGDRLVLVVSTPPEWRPEHRTVVLVHGLCGCYGSPYMKRIAGKLYRRGIRAIRVNLRGCGSGAGLARYPYHSGRSDDARQVIEWLDHASPESPVTLVGFSLGGNIVLKMAGEDADRPSGKLDSLISISPPIDLIACSQLIEQPHNRIYDRYFVRRLLSDIRERQRFFPDLPVVEFPSRPTLRAFDDLYTAPRSGFRDALDYYTRASSGPLVERIVVPTLIVSSRDDPFIAVAPFEQLPQRRNIELCITQHGGHLGFLGFTGQWLNYRWMDELVVDWIGRLYHRTGA
jgi:predicted alpha/beta-fold hydrolase